MAGPRILALPGWAQPAESLSVIVPDAEHFDYARYSDIDAIGRELGRQEYDAIVGWSLGGVIARQLLARGDIKSKALISIASPFQFVRDEQLHEAMPQDTFNQFYANYRDDAERTASRFHGLLVKGDSRMKELLSQMRIHPTATDNSLWLPWLGYLKDYSAREQDYSTLPPTLLIHGRNDAIVPYAQSEHLRTKLPNAELITYDDASHVPHVHAPEIMREQIRTFIERNAP